MLTCQAHFFADAAKAPHNISPAPEDDCSDAEQDCLIERRGALSAHVGSRAVPALEPCLVAVLPFLGARDIVRLARVNRACAAMARTFPLRLDLAWGALSGSRQLKRLARARRAGWLLGGLSLLLRETPDADVEMRSPEDARQPLSDLARARTALQRGGAAVQVLTLHCEPRAPSLFAALSPLPSLRELTIVGDANLASLSAVVAGCKHTLRALTLRRCGALVDLSALGELERLETLSIRDCPGVADLRALRRCSKLRHLTLEGTDRVREVVACLPLSAPVLLESLSVSRCGAVASVAGVDALHRLDKLALTQLPKLAALPASLPPNLRELRLSACVLLTHVPALRHCRRLAVLDMSNTFVGDVEFLRGCDALVSADFALCRRVRALDALAACPALLAVSLWRCGNVRSLAPLAHCANLRWLDLTGTTKLEHAEAVSHVAEVLHGGQNAVFMQRAQFW